MSDGLRGYDAWLTHDTREDEASIWELFEEQVPTAHDIWAKYTEAGEDALTEEEFMALELEELAVIAKGLGMCNDYAFYTDGPDPDYGRD